MFRNKGALSVFYFETEEVHYFKQKIEEVKDHFQILLKNTRSYLFPTHKYKSYLISDEVIEESSHVAIEEKTSSIFIIDKVELLFLA